MKKSLTLRNEKRNPRMMKIVVTGASGQLGSELRRLSANGGVWIFGDLPEMDITDAAAVTERLEHEKPDVIINCAACTNVDAAETDRETAFAVNAAGPAALAAFAVRNGAALIHISTDFVFDGAKGEPYNEDDIPVPLNVYGESKLAGERAVLGSGCRGAVIRTSWLYSTYGRNFVKSIMAAAAAKREIKVVSDQWGSPTAADGLAGAVAAIVGRLAERGARPAELFHYCDAGVVNRSGFAEEIVRLSGAGCKVVPVASSEYATAAQRPPYSAMDTSKITRTFGIVPRPWQLALAENINKLNNES